MKFLIRKIYFDNNNHNNNIIILLNHKIKINKKFSTYFQKNENENEKDKKKKINLFLKNNEKEIIDSMIRVNHAGEVGAQKIYEGQLAILKNSSVGDIIKEMSKQEEQHLKIFERLIIERRVRPTALMPFWNIIGYTIGAGSALLGKEVAMALTVAVEEVISEHYNNQLRELNNYNLNNDDNSQLKEIIKETRDDELHHMDIGIKYNAENIPFYNLFTSAVKLGTKTAIWLSTRI